MAVHVVAEEMQGLFPTITHLGILRGEGHVLRNGAAMTLGSAPAKLNSNMLASLQVEKVQEDTCSYLLIDSCLSTILLSQPLDHQNFLSYLLPSLLFY